jgi:hypothetical protein
MAFACYVEDSVADLNTLVNMAIACYVEESVADLNTLMNMAIVPKNLNA